MILCCGEALIDMIPYPTELGRDGFVPHSGGASFNTAIAIGRLGGTVGMLTGLSSDMFGDQLRTDLKNSNVDASHVAASDRNTTLAFVKLTDGHASYSFFDENSAGRMLNVQDFPAVSDQVDAMLFGGISLACEPGADAYAALMAEAGKTRVVMLDPNIRTGFIEDEARYRDRLNTMIGLSDIIKTSDEDLDWLIPDSVPMRDKVQSLLDAGPSIIILTRGSEGATAYLKNGAEVSVPSEKATVVDTVGAGDTFNAGVLAKLQELGALSKSSIASMDDETLRAALAFAARVAAVTVSRSGANPPWKHELV